MTWDSLSREDDWTLWWDWLVDQWVDSPSEEALAMLRAAELLRDSWSRRE